VSVIASRRHRGCHQQIRDSVKLKCRGLQRRPALPLERKAFTLLNVLISLDPL
jgi:hypothetical protein